MKLWHAMDWDVMIGVGRRSWQEKNAMSTTKEGNEYDNNFEILLPFSVDDELFEDII